MFQAVVLACLIAQPDVCIEFVNARHPLRSVKECEERVFEMANSIAKRLPDYQAVAYKCTPLKDGKLI